MIRIVLDTNVLVSALLKAGGPPAQLLLLALNGPTRLCITGSIYAEYEEVIRRPRVQRSPELIAGTLQAIREASLWVRPKQPVNACSDPDDDIWRTRSIS
jgi:putative PIN family toxin of toxin-antitoxin system